MVCVAINRAVVRNLNLRVPSLTCLSLTNGTLAASLEVFNAEEQYRSFQLRRGCFFVVLFTRTAAFLNSAGSCLLHLTFAAIANKRECPLKLEVCMWIVTTEVTTTVYLRFLPISTIGGLMIQTAALIYNQNVLIIGIVFGFFSMLLDSLPKLINYNDRSLRDLNHDTVWWLNSVSTLRFIWGLV